MEKFYSEYEYCTPKLSVKFCQYLNAHVIIEVVKNLEDNEIFNASLL